VDGFYVYNESQSWPVYIQIDNQASGVDQDLYLGPLAWRVFPFRVTRYLSVWCKGKASVNIGLFRQLHGEPLYEVTGTIAP
jgi:hypothetical protein